jgi:hypothetical protein
MVSQLHRCWVLGKGIRSEQIMRGPRFESPANDVQPSGNTREPQVKPSNKGRPLIPVEYGPIFGAVITAAASLMIYSFNQIRHIDERLDALEQEARVLIDGEGKVRPSAEALGAKYHLEALQDRIERLERHSQ